MKTVKHTPRPWKVDEWNYSTATPPHKDLVVLNSEMKLATVDWDEGNDNPYTVQEQTAKANARLIAAAPDLLEALKALLDYANDYSDAMAKEGKGAEQLGTLADSVSVAGMARAAIAKATE